MILGKVKGTVVSSTNNLGIRGSRLLLIEKCDQTGQLKNDFVVALDFIGAGPNEMVMVAEGSPCRETPETISRPVDALVTGIIDLIDENERIIYRK